MPSPAEDVRNGRKAKLPSPDSGLWEAAQRFWRKSYAGDYLGLLLIAVLFLFVEMVWEPFHQMFVLEDLRIQHPWAEVERVDVCTWQHRFE
jgi:diacylglycerol diphosphate phosphatase/phosphatidate phosphatase